MTYKLVLLRHGQSAWNKTNQFTGWVDVPTVLIAAHGNSLRAIVKMLDNLSEEEIAKVNIPTAMPLLYELDENFKPIKPRGEYLDPEAAAAGAAAVAAQGQK